MVKRNWIPTVCHQCKTECPIIVRLEDGVVKEIKGNPKREGKVCPKGMAGISLQYNPDRLKYPMKRVGERGENKFERITWEEAYDTITAKLKNIKQRDLAHQVTFHLYPHTATDIKWRFINAYGGFVSTVQSYCDSAKLTAFLRTTGGPVLHHTPPAWFTVPKGGIMIMAGRNAMECLDNANVPQHILEAKERGAKLVVLDPLFTTEAAKADLWIPIKPSGDTAFFMGLIHHIIKTKLYKKDFVEKWIRPGDFEKLVEYIEDKTPEKMGAICDVDPSLIRSFAEECAKAPSVGVDSFKGIMLGQAMDFGHAWTILLAITGNYDNPGGQALPDTAPIKDLEPVPKSPELHKFGYHRTGPNKDKFNHYEYFMEPAWYQSKAIKDGGLKALLVCEANPAMSSMGEAAWKEAVTMKDEQANYKLELLVVNEIFMSETAKYADLVLPDTTYFERNELLYMHFMYHHALDIMFRPAILSPLEECRPANQVYIDIGRRLVPEYFEFKTPIEYYDKQLMAMGLSIQKLNEMGNVWSPNTIGFRKYEERGFSTPSKKLEIYWKELEDIGQALPRPGLAPEYEVKVNEYPFILVSYRIITHQGTGMWTQNNPQLKDTVSGCKDNPILINPIAAEKLAIKNGDMLSVESSSGKLTIRVEVTERIRPDCVGLMHGFGSKMNTIASLSPGVNDNILIHDSGTTLDYQDLVGAEAHVSCRVKISKIG